MLQRLATKINFMTANCQDSHNCKGDVKIELGALGFQMLFHLSLPIYALIILKGIKKIQKV